MSLMTDLEALEGLPIEELKGELYNLTLELEHEKLNTYVGEIHTIHASDGEIHFGYREGRTLTIDADTLYVDLPAIINLVGKEQKKMQEEMTKKRKESIENQQKNQPE